MVSAPLSPGPFEEMKLPLSQFRDGLLGKTIFVLYENMFDTECIKRTIDSPREVFIL